MESFQVSDCEKQFHKSIRFETEMYDNLIVSINIRRKQCKPSPM